MGLEFRNIRCYLNPFHDLSNSQLHLLLNIFDQLVYRDHYVDNSNARTSIERLVSEYSISN
jgi:hypothetical protein